MLPTRWPDLFADAGWLYEVKWDGVRTLLYWDGRRVELRSRTGTDTTARYPELSSFRAELPVVLDGEIVALDDEGRPSFERLQQRMNLQSPSLVTEAVSGVPISFVVFDVLHHDRSIIDLALEERHSILDDMSLPSPVVRSEVVAADPGPLWSFLKDRRLEGIVAKRLGSVYQPGRRSRDWRKVSLYRQVRAVVGGYTEGEGGRHGTFGALLLGLWRGDALHLVGAVGSGFGDAALQPIRSALDATRTAESPFHGASVVVAATWVEPRLVALVQFKEWTSGGRLRAPSFKGFTDDDPRSVTWESEGPDSPG